MSTETLDISVVLPVFNGGATLGRAVKSILNQTYSNFELLIIDDGSTDDALAAVRSLNDPRIHLIGDTSRKGLAARLNEGIDASKGKYIARMDADDIAFPERLEKQWAFLNVNKQIDLVGCRAVVFYGERLIGLLPFAARHKDICARPWRGFPLPHPTWMGRAEWFRRFPYDSPEVMRAEDQELLLRSYPDSQFACLDEVLLGYHQGPFNFRKTLVARLHLLCAQIGCFTSRGQYLYLMLATILTCAKIPLDAIAALPGAQAVFFARMSNPVPEHVAQIFKKIKPAL